MDRDNVIQFRRPRNPRPRPSPSDIDLGLWSCRCGAVRFHYVNMEDGFWLLCSDCHRLTAPWDPNG